MTRPPLMIKSYFAANAFVPRKQSMRLTACRSGGKKLAAPVPQHPYPQPGLRIVRLPRCWTHRSRLVQSLLFRLAVARRYRLCSSAFRQIDLPAFALMLPWP